MIITGKPEKNVTLVVHLTQLFKFLKLISVTLTTSCRPDSIKIFNPKVAITDAKTMIPCIETNQHTFSFSQDIEKLY